MSFAHRLDGDRPVRLDDFDPRADGGLERRKAEKTTAKLIEELMELQELLYAVRSHSVLVVLQGRDTSGKDGAIRHVLGPLDSQSCTVASFKAPTEEELAHDFLWRVHARTPALGYITVFNRSHYEDVLVARVHGLVPEEVWRARYEHINAFERTLADSGTLIVKLYLHISGEEQEKRLLKREKDPVKAWKLTPDDWRERERWDEYTAAYEEALNRCSTDRAPWYLVPADRKWFRNLAVARTLRDTLRPFRQGWMEALETMGREGRRAVEEYRRTRRDELSEVSEVEST
jgi:PPK2 family polyphosphate:nucleotide phosphotransferase